MMTITCPECDGFTMPRFACATCWGDGFISVDLPDDKPRPEASQPDEAGRGLDGQEQLGETLCAPTLTPQDVK